MPTRMRPSPSSRAHSCCFVYRRSCGYSTSDPSWRVRSPRCCGVWPRAYAPWRSGSGPVLIAQLLDQRGELVRERVGLLVGPRLRPYPDDGLVAVGGHERPVLAAVDLHAV